MESWGKSPTTPTQTPETSQAGSSLGSRVPIPRLKAQSPPAHPQSSAPSRNWGRLWNATSPPDRIALKLGHPQPWTPHLRRAAPCSAPGRPSTPQARRPLQPARGHSELAGSAPPPPSRRPPALTSPRPARVGGARRTGEGSEGRPRPGARTRASNPRHACPPGRTRGLHGGAQDSSQSGLVTACVLGGSSGSRLGERVTVYPCRSPRAGGSWSLFQHKEPRRGARPSPSASLGEASLLSLQLPDPRGGRGGQPSLSGCRLPGTS